MLRNHAPGFKRPEFPRGNMAQSRSCSALDGEFLRKGLSSRLLTATSTMDEQYRESLYRHYHLLKTHIILTDDIIQQMANEKILPDTMIKDIQSGDTRDERNDRLLNALRLRGNKSYKRFRELMYRTGNFFVADLLWGEGDGPEILDEKDLAKFPGLLNCVQENQKKKLINYLDSKIREKALLLAWKHCPQDRIEALNNKAVDFTQERFFRETITSQEQKIKELELALHVETESSRGSQAEIASLKQEMDVIKRAHRTTAETQIRFHDANISSIARFKDRLARLKDRVVQINDLVRSKIDVGANNSDSAVDDDENDDIRITLLERNVRKMINKLKHTQEEASTLQVQREDVLKLLNRRYNREPLVSIIKDVLKHEQKHRSIVMRDILRVTDALKQLGPDSSGSTSTKAPPDPSTLDTKHFKSQLALLKAEAEHMQKRLHWKDSEISKLRQHVLSLRRGAYEDDDEAAAAVAGAVTPSDSLDSAHNTTSPSRSFAHVSPHQPPNSPIAPSTGQPHHHSKSAKAAAAASAATASAKPPPAHTSRSATPGTANSRMRSPGKRNMAPKTVTFQKSVQSLKQRTGHSTGTTFNSSGGGGGGGGGGGAKGLIAACKTDLDQTHVNIEQYLLEEMAEGIGEWDDEEKEQGGGGGGGAAVVVHPVDLFSRRLGQGDSSSVSNTNNPTAGALYDGRKNVTS